MNQTTTTNNDQVKSLIQIRKSLARGKAGNLAENKAFLDFVQIQKEVTAQFDETWEVVKDLMLEHDITSIKGDWGHVIMKERETFSEVPGEKIPPRLLKKAIDTKKVRAYMALKNGQLPTGIKVSVSKFIEKKIKAVA